MQTASKKVINGWAMYDWANSTYSLVIASTVFPAYYTSIAPKQVIMFGRAIERNALASYAISISFLIIAILSPILSSIADYKGNKKAFMKFFCYLGCIACISMIFFTKENIGFGLLLSIIAAIGYCGSIVFYNAYLPEIAAEEDQDRVSAKGYALGYIGSVILMVLCLVVIILNDNLNLGWGSWPARFSFVSVGLWWAGLRSCVRLRNAGLRDWRLWTRQQRARLWACFGHFVPDLRVPPDRTAAVVGEQ